jgi:hypothetical protein
MLIGILCLVAGLVIGFLSGFAYRTEQFIRLFGPDTLGTSGLPAWLGSEPAEKASPPAR